MTIHVQLPDGKIAAFPDGTAPETIEGSLKQYATPAPPQAKDMSQWEQWKAAATGVGQDIATAATGTVASAIGGARGLGKLTTGQGLNAAADAIRETQNKLTYQPEPSAAEHILSKGLAIPGKIGGYLGGKTLEATNSPVAATAVDVLTQAAPAALGARSPKGAALEVPKVADLSAKEAAIKQATDAGLKLAPSQAGGVIGQTLEGIAGQAKLERRLSKQNAPVVNNIAKQEIGLKPTDELSQASIAAQRAKYNGPYKEMSGLGKVATDEAYQADIAKIGAKGGGSFPLDVDPRLAKLQEAFSVPEFDAAAAVKKSRQLRADSGKNVKAPNAPEQNALGYAQRAVADALESQLDRHAQSLGKTDLVSRFREARKQLAKIHTVDDALSPSGDVSAASLAKAFDRGAPLSGGLKTIAEAHQSFGKVLQDVAKIRHSGPFGVLDFGVGTAGALSLHNPALLGAVLSRPLIRGALSSKAYQRLLPPGATKAGTALAKRQAIAAALTGQQGQ